MTMTKLRFIDSLRDERERDKNIVEITVTKVMIFELKELIVDSEMLLTLMNKTMMKMKQD